MTVQITLTDEQFEKLYNDFSFRQQICSSITSKMELDNFYNKKIVVNEICNIVAKSLMSDADMEIQEKVDEAIKETKININKKIVKEVDEAFSNLINSKFGRTIAYYVANANKKENV